MIVVSIVDLIFYKKARIGATFTICLQEIALAVGIAGTLILMAVVYVLTKTLIDSKVPVKVASA